MPRKGVGISPRTISLTVKAPILGLKRKLPPHLVDPRALVDCKNVEIFDGAVEVAAGWNRFEGMTGPLPDALGPVALIDELFKNDGTDTLVVGTSNDLYKRTGLGTFDFITPLYTAGTVNVSAANPAIVTGTGTLFVANVKVGDRFKVNSQGTWVGVASIQSDTQFTLTGTYPGSPHTGVAYTVRQLYPGPTTRRWISEIFSNHILACHLSVPVQKWDGVTAATLKLITDLPGDTKAKQIGSFSNRALLVHTEENGSLFPKRVRWCDDGLITVWLPAAGNSAGFLDITEGADFAVGASQLGNYYAVYKERSIHLLSFIGGVFVFARRQIVKGVGLLAPRAIADMGDEHIFAGTDNFYSFNGISLEPIGDEIIDDFLAVMDPAKVEEIIAWVEEGRRMLHFITPKLDGTYASFTYHYGEEGHVWTKRDLPATAVGYFAQLSALTWDQLVDPWAAQDFVWGSSTLAGLLPINIFGDSTGSLFKFGGVGTQNGAAISGFVQFGGLGLGLAEGEADEFMKELLGVEPWLEKGVSGHKIKIQGGKQNKVGEGFSFPESRDLVYDGTGKPGSSFRTSGKVFCVKFSTPDVAQVGNRWRLSGYQVKLGIRGKRGV